MKQWLNLPKKREANLKKVNLWKNSKEVLKNCLMNKIQKVRIAKGGETKNIGGRKKNKVIVSIWENKQFQEEYRETISV